MIREFWVKNFLSIKDKQELNFVAKSAESELYIRQNEKCAFYKTKGAIKSQKQQTPITKVCCFFLMLEQRSNIIQKALKKVKIY